MNNPPRILPKNIKIYDHNPINKRRQDFLYHNSEFPIFSVNIPNAMPVEPPNHTIISTYTQPIHHRGTKIFPIKHERLNKEKVMKYANPIQKRKRRIEKNIHSSSQTITTTNLLLNANGQTETKTNVQPLEIEKIPEEKENPDQKNCKICFEENETSLTGKLISPCKCTGSMRFIHEECLKTWLIAQKKNLPSAVCEICHKKYKMEFEYGWKFYWRQAFNEGLLSFILSIFLLFMIVGIIVMIIVFFNKINYTTTPETSEESNKQLSDTYKLAIMISCGFINAVLVLLFLFSLKEAFFLKAIRKWIIKDYNQKKKQKHEEKIINENNALSSDNKNNHMRFKSQSVNNLLMRSFFKMAFNSNKNQNPPKKSNNFFVSSQIIKITVKKSLSCGNFKKNIYNFKPKLHNSTNTLLKPKKLELSHIQKNNFLIDELPQSQQKTNALNSTNSNIFSNLKKFSNQEKNKTFEPIHFFSDELNSEIPKHFEENKKENKDDWQNILSFNSLPGSNKNLNDGFLGNLSEEFKSFDDEEKTLGVILNIKPINFDE